MALQPGERKGRAGTCWPVRKKSVSEFPLKTSFRLFSVMMLAFLCLGTGPAPDAVKGPSEIAAANNKFAFDLYSDLRESEKGKNLFISPSLAMTYEGADKTTADQMRKVFYFPANRDALRQGYSSLIQSINQGSKYYELSTANSLWPQAGYGFSKDYLGAIKKYYGGNAEEVNYSGNK